MRELGVLMKKELREHIRNYKVLWIPIVFIIFGILQPVSNHFLPEIMQSVGNMPDDVEFVWPELSGEDIFYSLVGQYQIVGILVIILAFMGSIAGERKNGTATLIYIRPMSFRNYFLSKWLVVNGVVLSSVWLGFFAAWYYIAILYNNLNTKDAIAFICTYSLWIVFVVTIVLALSTMLPTGGVAATAILITIVYPVIESIIGAYWTVSPWKLSSYANDWFIHDIDRMNLYKSAVLTVIAIVFLIIVGISMSRRNASKTTI